MPRLAVIIFVTLLFEQTSYTFKNISTYILIIFNVIYCMKIKLKIFSSLMITIYYDLMLKQLIYFGLWRGYENSEKLLNYRIQQLLQNNGYNSLK